MTPQANIFGRRVKIYNTFFCVPPCPPQVLGGLPERDPMDFVAMEASEVAKGKSWAEQEQEQEQQQLEKAEKDGAGAMDEEEGEGDESMEVRW